MHAFMSSKDFIMVETPFVNTVKSLQAAFEVGLVPSGVDVGVAWAVVCEITSKGAWTASLGTELLLQQVTEDSREKYQAEFPELFSGIEEMQGEYDIKLKPEARPRERNTTHR
ncbi:hypothetical protein MTO96_030349 [Rhipicephalus appendiculatus]